MGKHRSPLGEELVVSSSKTCPGPQRMALGDCEVNGEPTRCSVTAVLDAKLDDCCYRSRTMLCESNIGTDSGEDEEGEAWYAESNGKREYLRTAKNGKWVYGGMCLITRHWSGGGQVDEKATPKEGFQKDRSLIIKTHLTCDLPPTIKSGNSGSIPLPNQCRDSRLKERRMASTLLRSRLKRWSNGPIPWQCVQYHTV
jgi:hypothetical protein